MCVWNKKCLQYWENSVKRNRCTSAYSRSFRGTVGPAVLCLKLQDLLVKNTAPFSSVHLIIAKVVQTRVLSSTFLSKLPVYYILELHLTLFLYCIINIFTEERLKLLWEYDLMLLSYIYDYVKVKYCLVNPWESYRYNSVTVSYYESVMIRCHCVSLRNMFCCFLRLL